MNEEAQQGEEKSVARPKITLRKQIIPFEESNPAEEPLFINYAQVAHAGGVAYIDVGIIPLDEILDPSSSDATFIVLNRLVMSMETIAALAEQINKLLSGVGDRKVDLVQD